MYTLHTTVRFMELGLKHGHDQLGDGKAIYVAVNFAKVLDLLLLLRGRLIYDPW